MKVLREILEWSSDRPAWQRDALHRLVVQGDLSDNDLDDLTELCKSAHGLAEGREFFPFTADDMPSTAAHAEPVSLVSIYHHRGVNALAERQTLKFGPRLTVVYGDNAAGKTGYIRILKNACRARGQEKILGNVVSGAAPLSPVVAIRYAVGAETETREWNGAENEGDDSISRVSVFDTQSASVYLTEKTDVAFRPFGLDLFDKLVKACKAVRAKLEAEQRLLASDGLATVRAAVPQGTNASTMLASVSSLTNPESVRSLAHLSLDEENRLALLEKSLLDLQANDPEKLARQLGLRAERVRALAARLRNVEAALSDTKVADALKVREDYHRIAAEATRLREATFQVGLLVGTGSEQWKALWDAARRFSEEVAYPDRGFPFLANGALCVLCQQGVEEVAERLEQFESFATSTMERGLEESRQRFTHLSQTFTDLAIATEVDAQVLEDIRVEDARLVEILMASLEANEVRRKAVVLAMAEDTNLGPGLPTLVSTADEADALALQIEQRIAALEVEDVDTTKANMSAEAQELHARKILAIHEAAILDEIERKKRYAAYGLCVDDTKSYAITQKSTSVTKTLVSKKLKESFKGELRELSFRQVEVELVEAGGEEGVLYHKLVLTRAPGVELPKVVSEGEQRCLSIAAFFAELSTADDPSGIVFDDPVSSLDYKWREGVARRLVREASSRQVIVFTHDVVFLLLLKQYAHEQDVEEFDQHVRQLSEGAGVCAEELPWVATKVSTRLGHLRKLLQEAEKAHRDGHQDAYERDASFIYGLLREAWERGLEEVLLAGVVERYRPGVQTQQVSQIADITSDDCTAVEVAMTNCSRWLPGHDQAPAARADFPDPAVLRFDIDALEHWVKAIRKRRESGN